MTVNPMPFAIAGVLACGGYAACGTPGAAIAAGAWLAIVVLYNAVTS